jgi:SRSO17 transposase
LVRHALNNGIRVKAWTFDELYGGNTGFLDDVQQLKQPYVCEIPRDFHGWVRQPQVIKVPAKSMKKGRQSKPRVRKADPSSRVDNLVRYSPIFRDQKWQRWRIKDTDRGPEVWEVKHAVFWRKCQQTKLPTRQHTLLIGRNVLTDEVKYFLSNQVIGREGATLRWLLQVAFGRWEIEQCFRTAKEELGMDQFEVRGWRCVHRHWYVTGLSFLLCSRLRQQWDDMKPLDPLQKLTVEQVRSAINCWLKHHDLPPPERTQRYEHEIEIHEYHQRRNLQAIKSHTKTRYHKLRAMGIEPDKIKRCQPRE